MLLGEQKIVHMEIGEPKYKIQDKIYSTIQKIFKI